MAEKPKPPKQLTLDLEGGKGEKAKPKKRVHPPIR